LHVFPDISTVLQVRTAQEMAAFESNNPGFVAAWTAGEGERRRVESKKREEGLRQRELGGQALKEGDISGAMRFYATALTAMPTDAATLSNIAAVNVRVAKERGGRISLALWEHTSLHKQKEKVKEHGVDAHTSNLDVSALLTCLTCAIDFASRSLLVSTKVDSNPAMAVKACWRRAQAYAALHALSTSNTLSSLSVDGVNISCVAEVVSLLQFPAHEDADADIYALLQDIGLPVSPVSSLPSPPPALDVSWCQLVVQDLQRACVIEPMNTAVSTALLDWQVEQGYMAAQATDAPLPSLLDTALQTFMLSLQSEEKGVDVKAADTLLRAFKGATAPSLRRALQKSGCWEALLVRTSKGIDAIVIHSSINDDGVAACLRVCTMACEDARCIALLIASGVHMQCCSMVQERANIPWNRKNNTVVLACLELLDSTYIRREEPVDALVSQWRARMCADQIKADLFKGHILDYLVVATRSATAVIATSESELSDHIVSFEGAAAAASLIQHMSLHEKGSTVVAELRTQSGEWASTVLLECISSYAHMCSGMASRSSVWSGHCLASLMGCLANVAQLPPQRQGFAPIGSPPGYYTTAIHQVVDMCMVSMHAGLWNEDVAIVLGSALAACSNAAVGQEDVTVALAAIKLHVPLARIVFEAADLLNMFPGDLHGRDWMLLSKLSGVPSCLLDIMPQFTAVVKHFVWTQQPISKSSSLSHDAIVRVIASVLTANKALIEDFVHLAGVPALSRVLESAIAATKGTCAIERRNRMVCIGNACKVGISLADSSHHTAALDGGLLDALIEALKLTANADDKDMVGVTARKNVAVALAKFMRNTACSTRIRELRGMEILMQLGNKV
jgi:hypothetical protein